MKRKTALFSLVFAFPSCSSSLEDYFKGYVNRLQASQAPLSVHQPNFEKVEKAVWEVRINLIITEIYYTYGLERDGGWIRSVPQKNRKIHKIKLSHGSGFFISPSKAITNFHVVNKFLDDQAIKGVARQMPVVESIDLEITLHNDHKANKKLNGMRARIEAVSAIYDLALLESRHDVENYLKLASEPVEYASLFNLGYPGQFIVKRKMAKREDIGKYSFSADNDGFQGDDFSGASGSPVFNEKEEVAGVLYAGTKVKTTVINLRSLTKFLDGNRLKCEAYEKEGLCLYDELRFMCKGLSGRQKDSHSLFVYSEYCNFGEPKTAYRQPY